MSDGPANGSKPVALGERVRIDSRRRGARITICVEHCVVLAERGVFVAGWVIDPFAGIQAIQLRAPESGISHEVKPKLARPEILEAHGNQLKRASRKTAGDHLPGFWEMAPGSLNPGGDGLRLDVELDAGRSYSLALLATEEVRAIVAFLRESGLHAVAAHLPAASGDLPESWRDALLRLHWLLPEGSIEGAQLDAYLERGEPLAVAELPLSYGSASVEMPSAETMRGLRESGLFDERHYRGAYPELVASGIDLMTHYLTLGHREGRNPSSSFSTTYYRSKYLAGDPKVNPLVHYYETGAERGLPHRARRARPRRGRLRADSATGPRRDRRPRTSTRRSQRGRSAGRSCSPSTFPSSTQFPRTTNGGGRDSPSGAT